MIINSIEVNFDIDIRENSNRFAKGLALIQKKQKSKPLNDDDMEAFLRCCLPKSTVDKLLADGRLSTLVKVFTEFFSKAVDQFGSVSNVYKEAADTVESISERANVLDSECHGYIERMENAVKHTEERTVNVQ